jgi:hypothetical protein
MQGIRHILKGGQHRRAIQGSRLIESRIRYFFKYW